MTLLLQIGALLLAAWVLARLVGWIRLPPVLGMIGAGVALGSLGVFEWGSGPGLEEVASPARLAVLAVVLLRAGLGLSAKEVRAAGGLGIRLGILPLLGDALCLSLAGWWLLDLPVATAAVLGCLVAAISPAIVIPGLLDLLQRQGPSSRRTLNALLVGAPLDNVLALVAFGVALDVALAGFVSWHELLLMLPQTIGGGLILGVAAGGVMGAAMRRFPGRWSGWAGVAVIWGVASGLIVLGLWLSLSFVLAIIAAGFMVRHLCPEGADDLGKGLARLWSVAQYVLFALIGAAVDIKVLAPVGLMLAAVIVIGQLGRALGSLGATASGGLTMRERWAAVCCYVPKATIQAAFAALPLDRGSAYGELLLGAGVLAVVMTAPVGIVLLHGVAGRLLQPPDIPDSTSMTP